MTMLLYMLSLIFFFALMLSGKGTIQFLEPFSLRAVLNLRSHSWMFKKSHCYPQLPLTKLNLKIIDV